MVSFDEYCKKRRITVEERPMALAAYLHDSTARQLEAEFEEEPAGDTQ